MDDVNSYIVTRKQEEINHVQDCNTHHQYPGSLHRMPDHVHLLRQYGVPYRKVLLLRILRNLQYLGNRSRLLRLRNQE